MHGSMRNRIALVTGGASGIGRATAEAFAFHGAGVVVADVDGGGAGEVAHTLRGRGCAAIDVACDVSDAAQVEAMLERTLQAFGRLDVAFNNAGTEGLAADTAECDEENWDRVLDVNLKGAWLCMRAEIPAMLAAGGGAIVNCSSVAGVVGFRQRPAYVASKHGMIGLTRTAALEYAPRGIRVNAVCPGVIRTAMVERVIAGDPEVEAQLVGAEPVGRLGTAEEVAASVLWLCSDAASFVTGHALVVDGGFVAQ
jgi:NAD(P)-dependent dehydrogenase (short-subunit alcohol dehydrogenase family)